MKIKCPLFAKSISAGFPSPANDYIEKKLDLNEHLIENPSSTFYMRVSGNSMNDAFIYNEDIVIVDRSLNVKNNNIVIAVINGEMTIKRFINTNGTTFLTPENKKYPKIEIKENDDFSIWGIVTYIIHKAK